MTLQTKIISSFILSAVIVAGFLAISLVSLFEVRKEITYIELTDSIRSKSFQIRRHEKNYFLYREQKEIDAVHQYLGEINALIDQGRTFDDQGKLTRLDAQAQKYATLFQQIVSGITLIEGGIDAQHNASCGPMMKAAFVERPLLAAEFIRQNSPSLLSMLPRLSELDGQIGELRKTGEDIISISREIDKIARLKADRAIVFSKNATLIVFPIFVMVGIGGLFFISRSVVKRLAILTHAAANTGHGDFSPLIVPHRDDEVGILVAAFNTMESDLRSRDEEIRAKNEELFQSRKLASIGTLASGVAHELNNPLNNIYLSAQVLINEIPEGSPPIVQETVEEIYSETLRVKRIVNDLLEFSRARKPERISLDIAGMVREIVEQKLQHSGAAGVTFKDDMPRWLHVMADPHMMAQVIINLVDNAIDAMRGKGTLSALATEAEQAITLTITDSGGGIKAADLKKIYDPFFTTKDKGTGLGLSIVYSIIEKHSGTIHMESVEGLGTSFHITLPKE